MIRLIVIIACLMLASGCMQLAYVFDAGYYSYHDIEVFENKTWPTTLYYKTGYRYSEAMMDWRDWHMGCKTAAEIEAIKNGNDRYVDPRPKDYEDKMYSSARPPVRKGWGENP